MKATKTQGKASQGWQLQVLIQVLDWGLGAAATKIWTQYFC